jgi:hypothetical protein
MSARSDHLEIEHKFVVEKDDFDLAAFRRAALGLSPGPLRTGESRVQDTYFVIARHDQLIFRHRHDAERQELTLKSRGGDTEVRLEVNMRLDQGAGNQVAQVAAFLRPFGISWQGTLIKDIQVFYYSDCEVVYYTARAGDRELRCVELEATHDGDLAAAQKTLAHYEAQLGFAAHPRAQESLFELLLLPQMNAALGRPPQR